MLDFENTIRIERPAAEVFEFIADFENLPKWNYYVLQVQKTSPGGPALGTTYHQVRKTDEQSFRITQFEPNQRVAVKTLEGESPQLEMQLSLKAEGDATLVRDHWQLETGKPGLIEKLAAGRVKSAVAENLTMLKQLLEAGQTVLQDGRVARR